MEGPCLDYGFTHIVEGALLARQNAADKGKVHRAIDLTMQRKKCCTVPEPAPSPTRRRRTQLPFQVSRKTTKVVPQPQRRAAVALSPEDLATQNLLIFGKQSPGGATKRPEFSDMAQGQVGDCYFLATLSAIALRKPNLIEKAFVRAAKLHEKGVPEAQKRRVVSVQFYLEEDQPVQVAVDDIMPAYASGVAMFADWRVGQDAWPLLIEKAWAKLHGS